MPVQIGAQTISGGSSTQLSESLSRWANERREQQTQKNLIKARESGKSIEIQEEDGQKVMPEEKKPLFGFIGSKTVEQYNQGVRDAYILSIDTDNTQEINRIAQESNGDLDRYEEVVSKYRGTVLGNVDPAASDAVRESMDLMIARNRNGVQKLGIDRQIEADTDKRFRAFDEYNKESARLIRNGDLEGAQEYLFKSQFAQDSRVASGDLSPADAKEQFRVAKNEVFEQGHRKELSDLADQDIEGAFTRLDEMSRTVPKGWSPSEWDSFIDSANADLNQKVNRMVRFEREKAAQRDKETNYAKVEQRYKGNNDTVIVEPKVLDSYYSEVLSPTLSMMEPEQRQAEQVNFINRMKAIPKELDLQIENAVRSDNPELMAEAASLIDRIDEIEGVVNDIPERDQAYIQAVVNLMPNMEPSEAIKLARQATDPKDQARIDAVKVEIKEQFKKKNKQQVYKDKAGSAFGGLFVSDPDVDEVSGNQMAKEYGDLYESFRKAGMSEKDAFKKSDSMIKRNWGVTEALGKKRVMKYPPEMYYSINGDTSWLKDQLVKDINSPIGGASFGQSVRAKDIVLMANSSTERLASTGQPSYAVKVMIDGMFVPFGDWKPDMERESERLRKLNVSEGLEERKRRISKSIEFQGLEAL